MRLMRGIWLPIIVVFHCACQSRHDKVEVTSSRPRDSVETFLKSKKPDFKSYLTHKDAVVALLRSAHSRDRFTAARMVLQFEPSDTVATEAIYQIIRVRHPEFRDAIRVIAMHGPQALPILTELSELSNNNDVEVRLEVMRALGKIGCVECVPILVAALHDRSDRVALEAVQSLGFLGPIAKEAVQPLIERLKKSGPGQRSEVILALGQIRAYPKLTVSALVSTLEDDLVDQERVYVIQSLSLFGADAESSLPKIIDLIDDPDMRGQASWGFAIRYLHCFGEASKVVLPSLRKVAETGDPQAKMLVLFALGKMSSFTREAIAVLENSLADPEPHVRIRVLEVIENHQLVECCNAVYALALREQDMLVLSHCQRVLKNLRN